MQNHNTMFLITTNVICNYTAEITKVLFVLSLVGPMKMHSLVHASEDQATVIF